MTGIKMIWLSRNSETIVFNSVDINNGQHGLNCITSKPNLITLSISTTDCTVPLPSQPPSPDILLGKNTLT